VRIEEPRDALLRTRPEINEEGMDNPFDIYSWSKLYCEEALREASKWHTA
jgi:hypothetical protein